MRYSLTYWFFIIFFLEGNISTAQDHWDAALMSQVEIENMSDINTTDHEMSCFIIGDTLVYVKFEQKSKEDKPTKGEREFDLYKSIMVDGAYNKTSTFDDEINSDYIEGPGTYHKQSNTMYFTRTNEVSSARKKRKSLKLRIYKSQKIDSEWQKPVQLEFLLGDFNFLHPAISTDGRTLIFASDMPGGFGKMDLYYCRYAYGEWSKPINMGAAVNSEHNEVFPTIYRDMLFYSNDRNEHFDIYYNDLQQFNERQSTPLLAPFNSDRDDFSLVIAENGNEGYLSSNRSGGEGADDLYQLYIPDEVFNISPDVTTSTVMVIDKLQLTPVYGAKVRISEINLGEQELLNIISSDLIISDSDELVLKFKTPNDESIFLEVDDDGTITKELDIKSSYLLKVQADGYEPATRIVRPQRGLTDFTILMNPQAELPQPPIEPEIIIPLEEGETVVFNNIYYESNSTEIKQGAAAELDVLARVMFEKLELKVLLTAHTDALGTSEYNQVLSERRALAAKIYLVNKGINPNRIETQGFGESRLRNRCEDGVNCTKDEHRYNRRTEVTIL